MLEYGYALSSRKDQRIIGVFNEAFGEVKELPFDLAHKQWPIRYYAADNAETDEAKALREEEKKMLARSQAEKIKGIILSFAETQESDMTRIVPPSEDNLSTSSLANRSSAKFSVGANTIADQHPWPDRLVDAETGANVRLLKGPSIFLSVRSAVSGYSFSKVETLKIVRSSLLPLASGRASVWNYARSPDGAAAFTYSHSDPSIAITASVLTCVGSLCGFDCYHVGIGNLKEVVDPYIPTAAVEEILVAGLENFVTVSEKNLNLVTPLDVAVGFDGVGHFNLAVDSSRFGKQFIGPVLVDQIEERFSVDSYGRDPFDILLPFFQKIYDEAGYERPNLRS